MNIALGMLSVIGIVVRYIGAIEGYWSFTAGFIGSIVLYFIGIDRYR